MQASHARVVCLALIGTGAVAALVACGSRLKLEAENRAVAVVVDYDQLLALSAVSGEPMPRILERMSAAGATAVAVTEQTLHDVLSNGEVFPVSLPSLPSPVLGLPTASLVGPPEVLERTRRALNERLGLGRRVAELRRAGDGSRQLDVYSVRLAEVSGLGIGYPSSACYEIVGAQLEVVARPRAEGNQWTAAADSAIIAAQETGAKLVVFSGNAALGYPDNLAAVATRLRESDLVYGYVEFGKQYGDAALAARLPDRFVRVHSINETEMLGMTVQRALDRFVLAARERNIRACYVRLFAPSGPDALGSAEGYVRALTDQLTSRGFALGSPRPLAELNVPPIVRWLAGLGAIGAFGLVLLELLGGRPRVVLVAVAVCAGLFGLMGLVAVGLALKPAALGAAVMLPTLGVLWRQPDGGPRRLPRALIPGLMAFGDSCLWSVVGGLLVVGCLADTRFMVKLDQFTGVKLAHTLPLLGVLLIGLGRDLGGGEPGERRLTALVRGWRVAGSAVVRYWHAVLLLACVAGLGLLILRTGNESGVGVSGLELHFRSILNRIFGVRPRTKEVLIGHPLLVLAFVRLAGGRNVARWLLLTAGAIGQVSIVNTFTHIHTPVLVSLARTLHGVWFGALLGVGLVLVVAGFEWMWRRWSPTFWAPSEPPPG